MEFEIIRPNIGEPTDIIECQLCELSYNLDEYRILLDLGKLGYFFNEELGFSCHSCLFQIGKKMLKLSGKDEYRLLIKEGDKLQSLLFNKDA